MIEPKGNNVTIRPRPRDKVRPSGIIIPDTVKKGSMEWGDVLDVSGDTDIKVGDYVLFYGGKCTEENGVKLVEHKRVIYREDGIN